MDDTKTYATKRETQNQARMELYSKYSMQMNASCDSMVDIINAEIAPGLVRQIAEKPPQRCGRVVLCDGKTTKPCWELYNNKTWKDNPTFWMLFTSHGEFATSRTMVCDGVWAYEEAMRLTYNDDPYHHNVYDIVRIFDGLLAIGKECDLPEITLSLWKIRFDIFFADYYRASEARNHQTRDD